MANELTLPQDFMQLSLLHFQRGVPIDDLHLTPPQRRRIARVQHVYWQWVRNPFLDAKALLRQLVKGQFADPSSETRAAQKDWQLFEFVRENVSGMTRREAQRKVEVAAERAIRIGMETDNVQALTKGGKLLAEVAGLDKPESEQMDMNRAVFIQPVVVTNISEVDDTKEYIDDEQTKAIMDKYGGYVDEKRQLIEDKVAVMEARSEILSSASSKAKEGSLGQQEEE